MRLIYFYGTGEIRNDPISSHFLAVNLIMCKEDHGFSGAQMTELVADWITANATSAHIKSIN